MLEKNHIVANACSAVGIGMAGVYVLNANQDWLTPVKPLVTTVYHVLVPQGTWVSMGLWMVMAVLLFALGTLLPDIDSENSILGRYVRLPIEHRTWTHTIWIVLLLCIPAYYNPMLIWLTAGYFLHIWWDSVSVCGICWFYPLQTYRKYPGGAKIAKNAHFRLYRVGKTSEKVFVVILVLLTSCLSGFVIYSLLTQ